MRGAQRSSALIAVLIAAVLPGAAGAAGFETVEDCRAAIAADPEAAREEAAIWSRSGGGVQARICEAAALEAMGATLTAARLLNGVAENPNRAMEADLRATLFRDAARLWLDAGEPELASAALAHAAALRPYDPGGNPDDEMLAALAAAAETDWPTAQAHLEAVVTAQPENALALALLAAALRRGGDPQAGLEAAQRAVALDPDLPEAVFELAAAEAELGDAGAAERSFLSLIERFPDHALAPAARRNLQALD